MEKQNTPTTPNLQLTNKEKEYLENYKEENPFLKSLSDNYKEKGSLSEKQILALRKDADSEKNKLNRCPNTNLNLKQTCAFVDQEFNENKMAVAVSEEMNESDEPISIISLKSWFDRSDDFWKQSKPLEQSEKTEPTISEVSPNVIISEEIDEELIIPEKEIFEGTFTQEEIDDVYKDNDDLPF